MKKFLLIVLVSVIFIECANIQNVMATNSNDTVVVSKKVDKVFDFFAKIEEKLKEIKLWYDDNKEELKEESKKILQNDKEKIKNAYDDAKEWYNDNAKEKIDEKVDNAKEWYNDNLKDKVDEKVDSAKEWYNNNAKDKVDYIKDALKESYHNDVNNIKDFFSKFRKSE